MIKVETEVQFGPRQGQGPVRLFAKGSRRGKNWPARSCDMNVMDFAIFGCLKPRIFAPPRPTTVPELIAKLNIVIPQIPAALIRNNCRSVYGRCEKLLNAQGGFFE